MSERPMTVESFVLMVLIALWVIPPVLIILVMRQNSVEDGLRDIRLLPGMAIREISRRVHACILEPIYQTFDQEAKARRLEMIERDTITIEIFELQKQLDFAELKVQEYRLRIADPTRRAGKMSEKKSIRVSKKKIPKNKRKQRNVLTAQIFHEELKPRSAGPASVAELQKALDCELEKIPILKLKISDLRAKIDHFDTAVVLKEAQASEKFFSDLLTRSGCIEELTQIKALEVSLNEKIARMQDVAAARREAQLAMAPPIPRMTPERYREIIEAEKARILEERAKLPKREELAKLEKIGTHIHSFLNVHKKINDFAARVDPDNDRAFERLRFQFEQAVEAQEVSKKTEIKLQDDLMFMREKIVDLSAKISNLDQDKIINLSSTKTTLEASTVDLEASLNSLRRKNKANADRLFEVGLVVERLHIIRTLLRILPVTLRDNFDIFIQIVNSGCGLLLHDSLGNGAVEHIADRLAKLENNTLMAFIKMAKGESRKPKGRECSRFKERLNAASVELKNEREELHSHKLRWDSELLSIEESQVEFLAFAKYRRDRYEEVLATINQGLDVISILLSDRSSEVSP